MPASTARSRMPNDVSPPQPSAHDHAILLLGFLEARDADGAQRFWRRHLDQVAKYMITDPATTVVEVLA
jgi:DNA-binding GntR family transcriptional regulator